MSALSDFLENKLLDHVLRNVAYNSPAAVHAALFTSDPGETGAGTEVSGGGYARQAVTFSTPSGGATANAADVNFPVATANWGTITHVALFDAATGGNLLFYGALAAAKTVNSGESFRFPGGDLDVSLL